MPLIGKSATAVYYSKYMWKLSCVNKIKMSNKDWVNKNAIFPIFDIKKHYGNLTGKYQKSFQLSLKKKYTFFVFSCKSKEYSWAKINKIMIDVCFFE